jgi:CheY-like chemotaxis protein
MALVLVVDDHRRTCRLMTRLLHTHGFDAVAVESGDAAVAFVRASAHVPSIVLLDVMMPEADGFQTLARLRALRPAAELPVVMLSAMSDEEYRQRAAALGAADYWVKGTYDPEALAAMIVRHMRPDQP